MIIFCMEEGFENNNCSLKLNFTANFLMFEKFGWLAGIICINVC